MSGSDFVPRKIVKYVITEIYKVIREVQYATDKILK